MTTTRHYVTASIPYVNASPHVGHALELVEADVIARHHRRLGRTARLLNGTDDNAFKNVTAAAAAGRSVTDHVAAHAAEFRGLVPLLDLSVDDFLSTSSDPRHRPGVEALWRACAASGDLYRRDYEGTYCGGCEAFLADDDLLDGRCPDHLTEPEVVRETNWFFRLSRYEDRLRELVTTGNLRIEPEQRRNEVLGWLAAGLEDVSVSRDATRSGGWGIPVPGDPTQVIYVWWDALCNYITALGVGIGDSGEGSGDLHRWWTGAAERTHVIGKGILRFHALYWPALLLSAGLRPPTRLFVHDYLTVEGDKISKSLGNAVHPAEVVDAVGVDPFRWWCVADVARIGDTDFRAERVADAWNRSFPRGAGNLQARVAGLLARHRPGSLPLAPFEGDTAGTLTVSLDRAAEELPDRVAHAIDCFDLRAAAGAVDRVVAEGNRLLAATEPWKLANSTDPADRSRFDTVCASVLRALHAVAAELEVFTPASGAALSSALTTGSTGRLFDIVEPAPARARPATKHLEG